MSKTKELLKRLDEKIDQVQSSDEFKEILKTFSQFHNYSYHNSLLIKMQCPEASHVAGFRQWQKKFNRNVKKGETGIAILAPFSFKKTVTEIKDGEEVEKEINKTYFRPVYVFDISQTEGEPLPEMDLSIDSANIDLLSPLIELIEKESLIVEFKLLPKRLDGYLKEDKIVVDKSTNETEQASILIHELAHYYLHQKTDEKEGLTKEIVEMEAESVAFVVMDHFGVEIKSDKYLALYKESYDLSDSLQRINKVSSKILSFLEEADINGWEEISTAV